MAVKQETFILNDYGDVKSKVRRRTTSRGTRDRVSIEIQAEPLVHVFDEIALGAGPAQALRDAAEKAIKSITKFAKPSTIARRNYAKRALEGGYAPKSVRRRYGGGKLGEMAPKGSARLFNDSDRLSEGLFVRQNPREGAFTTNVPANRFTDDTQHLVEQLLALAPGLKPRELAKNPAVKREIEQTLDLIVTKAKSITDAKRRLLRQKQINAIKAAFGLGRVAVAL